MGTFTSTLGLVERQIDIIIGKLASGGDNTLGHGAYARATIKNHMRSKDDSEITFKDEETEYINPNHDDALGVFVRIINA